MVQVGDIVTYAEHVWDVVGCDQLLPTGDDGYRPVRLRLLRVLYRDGRRTRTFRETADSRNVAVIGRQDTFLAADADIRPGAGDSVTAAPPGDDRREVRET